MEANKMIKISPNIHIYDADQNGRFNAGDRIFYKGKETTSQDPRVQVETRVTLGYRRAEAGDCRAAIRHFADAKKVADRAGMRFNGSQAVEVLRRKMCLPSKSAQLDNHKK